MSNPIEQNLDETVKKITRGNKSAFSLKEHGETNGKIARLEKDAQDLYTLLTGRGYKKSGQYLRSVLESIRRLRGAQNFAFLKESRTSVESPYYGGAKGAAPADEEGDDNGDASDQDS